MAGKGRPPPPAPNAGVRMQSSLACDRERPQLRPAFEGLYIDKTDWKWEKYPVIHFEFNDVTTTSVADFETSFAIHVQERLEKAGFAYDKSLPPPENFASAIESLSAANGGKGVVILIDEYDAPVGHSLGDLDMAEAIRDRMSTLYSRMKNRTGDIRFLLMTGISKFTRLSVFSALSNLSFLLASCGFDFTMESVQANGRADVVAKHPAMVCVFELKVDEPVDEAFAQIHERGYAEPYRADPRPLWLIGLSFDSKTRNLVDWAAKNAAVCIRHGGLFLV